MSANKKDLSVINNSSKIKIIGQHFIQTEDCINNLSSNQYAYLCSMLKHKKVSLFEREVGGFLGEIFLLFLFFGCLELFKSVFNFF